MIPIFSVYRVKSPTPECVAKYIYNLYSNVYLWYFLWSEAQNYKMGLYPDENWTEYFHCFSKFIWNFMQLYSEISSCSWWNYVTIIKKFESDQHITMIILLLHIFSEMLNFSPQKNTLHSFSGFYQRKTNVYFFFYLIFNSTGSLVIIWDEP